MINIKFKKLRKNSRIPFKVHKGDAGLDCFVSKFCLIKPKDKEIIKLSTYRKVLEPNERILCMLGFATEIPETHYCQLVPRSGSAVWNGITIVNSPATIDSGYRDEWGAILLNTGNEPVEISIGDKVCQLIARKKEEINPIEVETLNNSERGKDKFGSTGK